VSNSTQGLKSDLFQVISISGGKDQTLALLKSGEILGWGSAGSGRITLPYVDVCSSQKNADSKPAFINKPAKFSNISAGYGASLGISERQKVFVWGFCQVGVGGKASFSEEPSLVDGVADAVKVITGQFLNAVIDQSGQVYTWGFNSDGGLGRAQSQINASPGLISELPEVEDVAIGDNFMIALTKDQRVFGWGSNESGQLGKAAIKQLTPNAFLEIA
jgi:alpha-tubulin suppressor-like RCC1 family protein